MSRQEDKIGRAAHLKRHTVGTSNEISFSVLDAAKNAIDPSSEKDRGPRVSTSRPVSLFTLPHHQKKTVASPMKQRGLPHGGSSFASSATSYSTRAYSDGARRSPEEEISRRKVRRRRHRMLAATLVILIGLGLAGAGGLYLFKEHQSHQAQIGQLDGALTLISQADETIVAMDAVITQPLDDENLATMEELMTHVTETQGKLDEADRIARDVSVEMRDSAGKEAANQAVAAISARRAMLDYGSQVMESAHNANEAVQVAREAWQEVLRADGLARDAAALVVDTTDEHVNASKEKTEAASVAFTSAQKTLAQVDTLYPDADLSAYGDYIAKRLEAMDYAKASDEAFLEKNKEDAVTYNDAYNRADAEAVSIADDLPEDIASPVMDAYEQVSKPLLDTYATARLQAGSADAFLRDYLGGGNK